ncbi:ER membrane protein complex subunit 6-like isoform X2 [Tachypleus tridentatus]|uniref:ER membrane protein complex subunit 6-like isoform X2 n=2 Tax=Tachypleus tridentatus TaxID=6853 RepID=UPI003FD32E10
MLILILIIVTKFCTMIMISPTSVKSKAKKEKCGEVVAYSEGAVRQNAAIVEYCRISMSALSGSTAGLLGLTAVYGFAFYFMMALALWVMLIMKMGSDWKKYFRNRTTLLTSGLFGGLFTYVLFWTFLYGMVHVY